MNATAAASAIEDLFTVTLDDGLPVESQGKTIRYRTARLRETSVADERIAQRLAERVANVGGVPKLLVSDADFRFALTMRHIESFACDGTTIGQAVIDLDLMGKLSSHDLALIEQRIFLITLAAEVRYGNLSQADFDQVLSGQSGKADKAPQRVGQAEDVGQPAAHAESGPALLADYVGGAAAGAPPVARG